MKVVLLSRDLMLISKVSGAAQRQGVELATAAATEQVVAICRTGDVAAAILDLTACADDVHAAVGALRSLDRPPGAVLAFGPHVHELRLQAARDAGCDEVFARGQFIAQMDPLLARFAGR